MGIHVDVTVGGAVISLVLLIKLVREHTMQALYCGTHSS